MEVAGGRVRLRTTQAHKGEVAQESPRWFQKRLRQRALARSGWANGQLANGLGVALPRNMQPQSLKMLTNAITPTIDKVNNIVGMSDASRHRNEWQPPPHPRSGRAAPQPRGGGGAALWAYPHEKYINTGLLISCYPGLKSNIKYIN
jgi:hypothetical protein